MWPQRCAPWDLAQASSLVIPWAPFVATALAAQEPSLVSGLVSNRWRPCAKHAHRRFFRQGVTRHLRNVSLSCAKPILRAKPTGISGEASRISSPENGIPGSKLFWIMKSAAIHRAAQSVRGGSARRSAGSVSAGRNHRTIEIHSCADAIAPRRERFRPRPAATFSGWS
jgi:hypothetical protein